MEALSEHAFNHSTWRGRGADLYHYEFKARLVGLQRKHQDSQVSKTNKKKKTKKRILGCLGVAVLAFNT